MIEFDRGPLSAFAKHFAAVPTPGHPERFWYDWGPVFYRGRLNDTARVLRIASDPGPPSGSRGECSSTPAEGCGDSCRSSA